MKKETQRGMKKWAPFKALENQDQFIKKIINKNNVIEFPSLSEEQINEINYAISKYINKKIKVKYLTNRTQTYEGYYRKLNLYDNYLLIDQKQIPISSIIEIILIEE